MNVTYGPDGLAVTDTSPDRLVCAAHPDLPFPHGGCGGPGAPETWRAEVLRDALRKIRFAAQFGDSHSAHWLDVRDIDHRSGDDL